jgi:ATP-binding cassette subfamily E protein 1
MFDEPSSYLDVKQRLNAARMIRSLLVHDNYVIVVEHDLSILDYLSDFICCLYGAPGSYGVVTMPFSVREGINIFLAGFVPTENLRFRDEELTFKVSSEDDNIDLKKETSMKDKTTKEKEQMKKHFWTYPKMEKTLGPFHVTVEEGVFGASETIVMLGQNGTGKTTMIKMLAGLLKPDDASISIP